MRTLLLATVFMLSTMGLRAQKDLATYEPVKVGEVEYSIENLWLKSSKLSGAAFKPGTESRGMAAKDGKMYFCDRADGGNYVVVYNGLTGEKEKTVKLPDNVFTYGEEAKVTEFPCNDIQFDDAGNLLVANMTTNMFKTPLQVWIVEINGETAACTQVMSFSYNDPDQTDAIRIDAFNVYGDMKNDGFILAALSGAVEGISNSVLKFNISGGALVDEPEQILIQSYVPTAAINNGTAPRVCPIDENYFYLDGFNSYATLYDMDGNLVDGFNNIADMNAWPPKTGHNGVDEFTITHKGEDHNYVILAWDNTEGATPTTWSIFELGANGFADMTKLFTIPQEGMGGGFPNAVRTAVPCIDVNGSEATIYLYGYVNGAGAYKLKLDATSSLSELQLGSISLTVNDEAISLSENANLFELYSLTGERLASKQNASSIASPNASGIYIVKVIAVDGQSFTRKVLIK